MPSRVSGLAAILTRPEPLPEEHTVPDTEPATEPTLAATREAAEQARAACHAGYNAPKGDTSNVYDRTGAVFELLTCVQQMVEFLGKDAERLTETPGLDSTNGVDGVPAAHHARHAALRIRQAAEHIGAAANRVNMAWSELSPLFVRLPDNEEPA